MRNQNKRQDTQLKCTWTNGLIWSAITIALAAVCRYLLIWYCVPAQTIWVFNGVETVINFTSDFYNQCMVLLMGCIVIPVLTYLLMYRGYMKLAGKNPSDLHLVATDKVGKPWIFALALQIILTVVWSIIGSFLIYLGMETGRGFSMNDRIDIEVFLVMMVVVLVVDIILFVLGKLLFKPDLVQRN